LRCAAYLKQLYVDEQDRKKGTGARMKEDVPPQTGVAQLAAAHEVLACDHTLRALAVQAITRRKVQYCENLSGMPPFGHDVYGTRRVFSQLIL